MLVRTGEGASLLHFVDHEAASQAVAHALAYAVRGADDIWLNPEAQVFRALIPALRNSYPLGRGDEWAEVAGFGPLELRQTLEIGARGQQVLILGMAPGVTDRMARVLAAQGYQSRTGLPHPAWGRGEDNGIDLAARDPADPFGGGVGRASRVALIGDVAVQGPAWMPVLAVVAGSLPGVTDDPTIRVIADGIDALAPRGAVLVQAIVMLDPADLVPGVVGQLPWSGAAIIDLSTPEVEIGALVLAFADARSAEAVARHVEGAWSTSPTSRGNGQTMAQLTGLVPDLSVVGDAPAALVMTLTTRFDHRGIIQPNFGHDVLMLAVEMRDMVFLPTP